jgi:glycosyltransferase involved in cell wall biosynthesis
VVTLPAQPPRAAVWIVANLLPLLRLHRFPGATLRERARVSRTVALHTGPEMGLLRTRALRPRLSRALPLDAVVQVWTSYRLAADLRIATYEDMTVRQAVAIGYPEWTALSPRERDAAIARQAQAYARAFACCFTTNWAAESALRDYGVPREKVHVVGIGRNHTPRPVPRDWSTPRFLFVGGDWKRKNGDALVRAFARLRERIPGARLDLVGRHPAIDVEGVVGHGALSLARADERDEVEALFERATCFVMPSRSEPSAIAYVEAAAAGVPSIGSAVGGSRELIGDGGCVVDPRDDEALFAAMLLRRGRNGASGRRERPSPGGWLHVACRGGEDARGARARLTLSSAGRTSRSGRSGARRTAAGRARA